MNVLEAHVRRSVARDGVPCGEVEVHTDDPECKQVLAYFAKSGDNEYDVVYMLKNDADFLTDWYDNSMHTAFEEISAESFQNMNMKTGWDARESFKNQVLGSGRVREDLHRLLG